MLLTQLSCSIGCYKTHKVEHATDAPKEANEPGIKPPEQTATQTPATKRALVGSKKVDFTDLENDQQLREMLTKHEGLRIQLQSVYGYTLEPPPDERRSQRSFRGGRGGRGGRDFMPSKQHISWTQAKGDKEAQGHLKRLREADEDGGIAEFVRLIEMRYSKDAMTAGQPP
ncbi:hypothetical protein MBLNU457_g2634t1 [Dothideomycetes sp. NU457]